MKSATKLKDQARRHEQREEWDRAIQLYLQVLNHDEEGGSEADLPLYNRVGDLYVRMGRPDDAVTYYEQAADHYAEAGLYNNAIALCNKALRYQPNRVAVFRKLGQFCAQQGFLTDARRWYLEYAERMFRLQKLDEAFSALADFADISEDPEVRVHLARKLQEHGRDGDALNEFHRAWEAFREAGRGAAADALQETVRELLPDAPSLADIQPDARRAGGYGSAADALPTYEAEPEAADAPVGETAPAGYGFSSAPQPEQEAVPQGQDAEEPPAGTLEGLESTQLADEDTTHGADTGMLAGLDTGRDDTLERMQTESAPGLPLLDEQESPDDEADVQSISAGLPLLDDTPGEPETEAADEPPADPFGGIGEMQVREPVDAQVPSRSPGSSTTTGAEEAGYVDLYALLAPDEDRVETTRFFVQETEPTGDEDHDFAELLNQFRAKLAEHVPENDAGSHYDLGLAFKEMELYDDAISEFQIALRAGQDRLKVFEELGQCFIQKQQYNVAVKVLTRALQFEHRDESELIGVYYFLGEAYEQLGQTAQARDSFERVLGLDIRFRDVQERVARL